MNQRTAALRRLFTAVAALIAVTSLQAHPGHGLLQQGPVHAMTSPFHVVVLALLGATLFGGAHLVRRRLPRRALQSIGALAMVISAVLWGLQA